jgi:anti-sigma factor RsiW
MGTHITDTNLERYYLGMIPEGPELDKLEEHLLACPECVDRTEETEAYVDEMRAAAINGGFDKSD